MRSSRFAWVLPGLLVAANVVQSAETTPTFEKNVRPILKAMCFHCHGEMDKPKAKLDLRLARLIRQGGASGPAIVPGKPEESLLYEQVQSDAMPPGHKKLTAAQKKVLHDWIAAGAKTLRPEPNDPELAKFSEEELAHWAFQPVRQPKIPTVPSNFLVRSPMDAFIAERLAQHGLSFSPEADKRTLIRRVTFDLIGLPPTVQEVEAFVQDTSADAYEKVVDRLLASPHYGERWGRHWLDVAGYAETDGTTGVDHFRPQAWRYRDYVIRSFNEDKPYDQFLREQIAGDELAVRPFQFSDPRTIDQLTATAFLRLAPDVTQSSDTPADRNQAIADSLKVFGSAVLGLTLGCAQCHDHRYDPISQEDYYRLRAIFDPAMDWKNWQRPNQRMLDVTPPSVQAEIDRIEKLAASQEAAIRKDRLEVAQRIQNQQLEKVDASERDAARQAIQTPEAKRTAVQKALLKKYPSLREVVQINGALDLYDPGEARKFQQRSAEVAKLRATKPAKQILMTTIEPDGAKTESRVMHRGDHEQLKQAVTPAELMVLARHRPSREIPPKAEGRSTTGRRLAYAQWLTDGSHPLTARVIVNRVWMHHFGRGIVNTPGEFGINGERPTHPELLDWLADDLVRNGWKLKRLHRLIVTSTTYRQVSKRTPELERLDPDNRWLGRMSVRRLEAEAIRDSLLAVTDSLNPEMGGPSVSVTEDYEGRGVVGKRELSVFGKPYGPMEKVPDTAARRRSIYLQVLRSIPLSMLETFDLPTMTPNCDARRCSTVTPQALLLLNDQAIVQHAELLAERLWKEASSPEKRVQRLFELLYSVAPSDAEMKLCLDFLRSQADYFREHGTPDWLTQVKKTPHAPEKRATAMLCQTLLCTNRFLYVD